MSRLFALCILTLCLTSCKEAGMLYGYVFTKKEQPKLMEAHRKPCGQPGPSGYQADLGCGRMVAAPQAMAQPPKYAPITQVMTQQNMGYRPIASGQLPQSAIAQSYIQPAKTNPKEFEK